jgi:DNA-binding MarR family transcriptional regulator
MDQETSHPTSPELAIDLLRHIVVAFVRRDGIALSTQQFGIFLACYLCPEATTLRGLVQELDLPRTLVLRALEKLAEIGLILRSPDARDSRNQILEHTKAGLAMLNDLHNMAAETRTLSFAAE